MLVVTLYEWELFGSSDKPEQQTLKIDGPEVYAKELNAMHLRNQELQKNVDQNNSINYLSDKNSTLTTMVPTAALGGFLAAKLYDRYKRKKYEV